MFRKTTSKIDPGATIVTELRKEFGKHFHVLNQKLLFVSSKYPRQIFAGMVICMLISGVLAFSVMRTPVSTAQQTNPKYQAPAASGLNQLISTAEALKSVWELQARVNELLKKDTLSHADSLFLQHALEQINTLQKQLHNRPAETPAYHSPSQQQ